MKKPLIIAICTVCTIGHAYAWEQHVKYTNGRWIELPSPTKGSITLTNEPNKGDFYAGGSILPGRTYRATLPDDRTVPYLKSIFEPVKPYKFVDPEQDKLNKIQQAVYLYGAAAQPRAQADFFGYNRNNPGEPTIRTIKNEQTVNFDTDKETKEAFADLIIKSLLSQPLQPQEHKEAVQMLADNLDNPMVSIPCVNSQDYSTRIKQNPNVISAYFVIGGYYTWTHWIKEYCADYTVPQVFISRLKTELLPYMEKAEKLITDTMGYDYKTCVIEDSLTSETAKKKGNNLFMIAMLSSGILTKRDFCATLNDENSIKIIINNLSQDFTTMGF